MREEELAYHVAYVKTLWNRQDAANSYREVYDLIGFGTVLDILIYENDFHNLKTVLKAVFADVVWQNLVLSPSVVQPELIEKCIKTADFSPLPEFLENPAKTAYEMLLETSNYGAMEIFLDNAFKNAVLERARAEKDRFFLGWAELFVKLINYKTLWRCVRTGRSREFMLEASGMAAENIGEVREMILKEFPDADCETIAEFEGRCREKELTYVGRAKGESFSLRPIMAYLVYQKGR